MAFGRDTSIFEEILSKHTDRIEGKIERHIGSLSREISSIGDTVQRLCIDLRDVRDKTREMRELLKQRLTR